MKKLILSLLLVTGIAATGYGQIFSQDFSSSTDYTNYTSATATPNALNRLTTISSPGGGTPGSVSTATNVLSITRNGTGTGGFVRSSPLNFTGNNSFICVRFDFSVSGAATTTSAVEFQVGSGYGTGVTGQTSNSHSRFSINFLASEGGFSLRDIAGSQTGSTSYTTKTTISFYINNSGGPKTYLGPDGASHILADDTWDLWGGTTLDTQLSGKTAANPAIALDNMRLTYVGGSGTINIDDIFVYDAASVLPVSLSTFTAKANLQNIDLAWSTASEKENSHFDVLRSGDGKSFSKIGEVAGAGSTNVAKNYSFTDRNALPGTSYYRLKQIDKDGKSSLSEIVPVKSNVAASNFKVASNKQEGNVRLTIFAANEGKATFKIYDLNGRKLVAQELTLSKGYSNISVPFNGGTGLHIASLTTATETATKKFIQ